MFRWMSGAQAFGKAYSSDITGDGPAGADNTARRRNGGNLSSAQARAASVAQAQRAFATIAELFGVPDAGYGTPEEAAMLLRHATDELTGQRRNRFTAKSDGRAPQPPRAPSAQPTSFYGGTKGKPLPWFMGQINAEAQARAQQALQQQERKPEQQQGGSKWQRRKAVQQKQDKPAISASSFYANRASSLGQAKTAWFQFGWQDLEWKLQQAPWDAPVFHSLDGIIEAQAKSVAAQQHEFFGVLHAEATELEEAIRDWCRDKPAVHITLVKQAVKDVEAKEPLQEIRKVAGKIGVRSIARSVLITKIDAKCKSLKEGLQVTKSAKKKKYDNLVVLKVVALKRFHSQNNDSYDEVADNPEYYLQQWAVKMPPAHLHAGLKDSFQWFHKAGVGGGRARSYGSWRVVKDAVPTLAVVSGGAAMVDRRNVGGSRSKHVKVRFGVGAFRWCDECPAPFNTPVDTQYVHKKPDAQTGDEFADSLAAEMGPLGLTFDEETLSVGRRPPRDLEQKTVLRKCKIKNFPADYEEADVLSLLEAPHFENVTMIDHRRS